MRVSAEVYNMAPVIAGKWKVSTGQFMGLVYEFRADGSFRMEMGMYGVNGSGTYTINDKTFPKKIDIQFTEHTSGAAGIGIYKGIWDLKDEQLLMKVGTANGKRWTDTSAYVTYTRDTN